MPEEHMMKIPLVEGWQHMKLNFRPYLFGHKERVVLNKKHDVFYKQGCIEYMDDASFIQLSVFVV